MICDSCETESECQSVVYAMKKHMPAYRVIGNGMVLARVEGQDDERMRQEIDRYALQYVREGTVGVQERRRKRWHHLYTMSCNVWPVARARLADER